MKYFCIFLLIFKYLKGIIRIVVQFFINLKDVAKSSLFYIYLLFQPLLTLFIWVLLNNSFEKIYINGHFSLPHLLLVLFAFPCISILFNALFESIFYFIDRQDLYAKKISIEKYSNNYAMIAISIVALIQVVNNASYDENLLLLYLAIFFTINTILSDVYSVCIYKKKLVANLVNSIKEEYQKRK